jgi:hypothetical protein
MPLTIALSAITLLLAVFCGWRGARPPDFRAQPRIIPYRLLMLLFGATFLSLLTHLVGFFRATP